MLFDDAFALAATVAVCEVVTDATFTANDAVDEPEATVTAAGTVTALLLLVAVTLIPVEGAAEVSDTVQVVDPEPVNELLPHEKELIEGVTAAAAPLRLIEVVFEVVPWVAVSVTVCAVVTADTVAVKLALVAPDGTVIEAGTVTELLLLESETLKPPLGAPPLNVNLQVSIPAPIIEEFVQLRPLRETDDDELAPFPCNLIELATLTFVLFVAVRLSWPVESVAEEGA